MDANRPETENLENVAAGDGATTNPVGDAGTANDEQLQRLQDELNGTRDQLLRTMADFQNFRARQTQKAEQDRRFATEGLVTALLPVLDNFERTIAHVQQGATVEQLMEGVRAVERQLRSALESQNVRRVDSVGQPFDPTYHEAIAMEASEEHEAGTVISEFESGYTMGDKVIRPARVKVASS
ncbi:MAG: nucleotide exchange factor GrpE [Fimbriimonas sp.]